MDSPQLSAQRILRTERSVFDRLVLSAEPAWGQDIHLAKYKGFFFFFFEFPYFSFNTKKTKKQTKNLHC